MTILRSLLLATISLLSTTNASAQLPYYEPFSYSSGRLEIVSSGSWELNSGNGFGGNVFQVVNSPSEVSPSLAFPDFLSGIGNRLQASYNTANKGTISTQLQHVSAVGTTLYCSFLLKVKTAPDIGHNLLNIQFITGSEPSATILGATNIYINPGPITNQFVLGLFNPIPLFVLSPTSNDVDSTLLVVLGYQFNSGTNNKSLLWINPTPGSLMAPTETISSDGTIFGNSEIIKFTIGAGGFETGIVEIDEFRVSTTWSDVVPSEPLPASATSWSLYE